MAPVLLGWRLPWDLIPARRGTPGIGCGLERLLRFIPAPAGNTLRIYSNRFMDQYRPLPLLPAAAERRALNNAAAFLGIRRGLELLFQGLHRGGGSWWRAHATDLCGLHWLGCAGLGAFDHTVPHHGLHHAFDVARVGEPLELLAGVTALGLGPAGDIALDGGALGVIPPELVFFAEHLVAGLDLLAIERS